MRLTAPEPKLEFDLLVLVCKLLNATLALSSVVTTVEAADGGPSSPYALTKV